jgi:hypothetical protein
MQKREQQNKLPAIQSAAWINQAPSFSSFSQTVTSAIST